MIRLTVHLIVLIFTATSHATVLCALWCGPQQAVTHTCGHSGPASRLILTRTDTCDNGTSVVGVVRAEIRRSGPAWDTAHAIAVARYAGTVVVRDDSIASISNGALTHGARPLDTNLRI